MDIRENIIQEVVMALTGRVSDEAISTVQDILIIKLNDYEVQERCTEVAVRDDSPEKMLQKFIATKRVEGISESTLTRYGDMNMKLIQFLRKPLNEVTTYDIRFFLSYKREIDGVKNSTLDGMRRCYSSFFGWMAAEGLITRNPCAAIRQIKCPKVVRKPYSAEEMQLLREACKNARDVALVDFLYCTGCRVSEAANLNVSDIDFRKKECIVLGKGNKERIVYLNDIAAMHLRKYLEKRKWTSDALFLGKGGKRIGKNGIEAMVKRLGKAAGVENAHPHRFRRTLATNLLDRGMNIQDVAKILGHADLGTTQVYCYITQTNVKSAYSKYAA